MIPPFFSLIEPECVRALIDQNLNWISQNVKIQQEYIKVFMQNNLSAKKKGFLIKSCYCCNDKVSITSRKSESFFGEYETGDVLNHTNWFNTAKFSSYSYFIKNSGDEPTMLFIQLSPDKYSFYDEKNIFILEPGETRIIMPLEYSFFSRLAFKSSGLRNTFLKIWFQGQV